MFTVNKIKIFSFLRNKLDESDYSYANRNANYECSLDLQREKVKYNQHDVMMMCVCGAFFLKQERPSSVKISFFVSRKSASCCKNPFARKMRWNFIHFIQSGKKGNQEKASVKFVPYESLRLLNRREFDLNKKEEGFDWKKRRFLFICGVCNFNTITNICLVMKWRLKHSFTLLWIDENVSRLRDTS